MQGNPVEILLIEDNTDDANLTIRALKKNNLANNLLHLKDGAAAIDFIFSEIHLTDPSNQKPKLILLDLKMPKINGIEVLRKLKSDERTKEIPVVVLTSSREDPDIRACYDLGVNSYVVKPVNFEAFIKTITELGLYWMILNQLPPK